MRRSGVISIAVLGLALGIAAACSGKDKVEVALAPESVLPAGLQSAPSMVREAYRFAVANQDVLSTVACYCGCGAMGHHSNLDCYVQAAQPDGRITFDDHAVGCGICVDIARDVMRMMRDGKPLADIRWAINDEYSRYGPPTPRATS